MVSEKDRTWIAYFPGEGKEYTGEVIACVKERVQTHGYKTILIFTAEGDAALQLRREIPDPGIRVIAVSFPAWQVFRVKGEGENIIKKRPGTTAPEMREALRDAGVRLIHGSMPLEDILLPNAPNTKTEAIRQTLRLFAGSMSLCVQAITMACDAGEIKEGDEVVAMSADTAIVGSAAMTRYIFHPVRGLQIREIICKPRQYSISRKQIIHGEGKEAGNEGV